MRRQNGVGPAPQPAGVCGAQDSDKQAGNAPQVPDRGLTREAAERIAWESYASDSPAVVELLLLADNPALSALSRYQAAMALEWFDPLVDLPRRPSDQEEPEPIRLLRLALLSGEMRVRIAAGDELVRMLAPSSAWTTAIGGR